MMSLGIDKLAEQIATLDRAEQEALFEKVAELTFQRGPEALPRQYRERLAQEGKVASHDVNVATQDEKEAAESYTGAGLRRSRGRVAVVPAAR